MSGQHLGEDYTQKENKNKKSNNLEGIQSEARMDNRDFDLPESKIDINQINSSADFTEKLIKQTIKISKVQVSLLWYILELIAISAQPVANLLIFFNVTYNLQQNFSDFTSIESGLIQITATHYGVIGMYVFILIVYIRSSFIYAKNDFKELLVNYFLLDNIFFNSAILGIVYIFTHSQVFCYTYEYVRDPQRINNFGIQAKYALKWIDVLIFVLYLLANLGLAGLLRLQLRYIEWTRWQAFLYKTSYLVGAILFIAFGLILTLQKDGFSQFLVTYTEAGFKAAYQMFNTTANPSTGYNFTGVLLTNYKINANYKSIATRASNFILLYVIVHFAFIFEIMVKFSDFDGTAELKFHSKLKHVTQTSIVTQKIISTQQDILNPQSSKLSKKMKSQKQIKTHGK